VGRAGRTNERTTPPSHRTDVHCSLRIPPPPPTVDSLLLLATVFSGILPSPTSFARTSAADRLGNRVRERAGRWVNRCAVGSRRVWIVSPGASHYSLHCATDAFRAGTIRGPVSLDARLYIHLRRRLHRPLPKMTLHASGGGLCVPVVPSRRHTSQYQDQHTLTLSCGHGCWLPILPPPQDMYSPRTRT
jgi:hypothetical protein